ncbi:MAG TPA: tetratricopeptide repeat-containing protein [Herpetosiphonaceae bacterium]
MLNNLLERFRTARPPATPTAPNKATARMLAADMLHQSTFDPGEMLAQARHLIAENSFGYARRVLDRVRALPTLSRHPALRLEIYQTSALCTYQDADLPPDDRCDLALDILCQVEDLETTTNQETLGLAGDIYQHKWEADTQRQYLERALHYYLRGYAQGPANDQGYTGINAAFILDLLAHEEAAGMLQADGIASQAEQRRAEASRIRDDIVRSVAPLIEQPEYARMATTWELYSTLAEALFGIGHYDDAVAWLERGRAAVPHTPEWQYQATVHQLATIAILQADPALSDQGFEDSAPWRALKQFLGDDAAAVRSAFIGKIGLALSGGGFRASLFHIGTLAKLAELDLLRHVEVLSCVSGGSIIGAHYYLEVRHLLQSKADHEITRQDYIDLVARIERQFVTGVQRNIRMRVGAEFLTNLMMLFRLHYSSTQRVGELYEREIFSRVADGEGNQARWLSNLLIKPVGERDNFNPKYHNWRRAAKVPILILNATTLNTGHNWQFTASWMGEPPASINSEIDSNDQLRRMYYWEAPEPHKSVRLGHAVAASACVPGLFEPLALDKLYPDRVVRLVDGGVCDNQGVTGLLEENCTVVLTSDGSGQMESQNVPSHGLLGVPLRTISILQARVREAEYSDLKARRRSALLRGFMFIHLKEDFDGVPIDWVDCRDPYDVPTDGRVASQNADQTCYGIARPIQQRLAAIRTDLDSFSDVEAYTLMTSAYRMTEYAFEHGQPIQGFTPTAAPVAWKFLAVESGMKGSGQAYQWLNRLLSVSNQVAFKTWNLLLPLRIVTGVLALGLAALAIWAYFAFDLARYQVVPAITLGLISAWLLAATLTALVTYFLGKNAARVIHWRETLLRIAIGIGMCLLGWIVIRIQLHIFDRWFLKLGSLAAFQRQENESPSSLHGS